jgi:hypothetical protein
MRERARQAQRGTENALAALERTKLPSYTDEEEISEVTLGKEGLKAKGVPGWAVGAAVVIVATAGAVWILVHALK